MTLDSLQQYLGGDPGQQQDYSDFLQRFQNDPNSISEEEATQRYRELTRNLPHDLAAEVHAQVLGQLPQEDRLRLAQQYQDAHNDPNSAFDGFNFAGPEQAADPQTLGRLAQQAELQDPNLRVGAFGQGSPLGGTLGKLAMGAIAAYLASRALGGQGGHQPVGGGTGGLGDLLGALGGQQAGAGGGAPDLGGLLSGLLGGQPAGASAGMGGLGGLLGGLLGGQAGAPDSGVLGTLGGGPAEPADEGDDGSGLDVPGSHRKGA